MQTLLIEQLVADRIRTLRDQGARERLAAGVRRTSPASRTSAGPAAAMGFWLVRVGLRLADAGAGRSGPG
jgi:hypothetical protein